MTYRIKSVSTGGYTETARGIENVSRFVECAIRDGYTILLVTQERKSIPVVDTDFRATFINGGTK